MPDRWVGTVDERLARLDHVKRRCDGNTRRCPRPAVVEFDLWEADGNGVKLPDAARVTKKSCSRHRIQYTENASWVVAEVREIDKMDSAKDRPYAAAHARFDATDSTWRDFIRECNTIDPDMFGTPQVSDWWAGGTVEEYPSARILHRSDGSISITGKTLEANDVMRAAGSRLGVYVGG